MLAYYDFEGDTNNNAGPAPNATLANAATITAAAGGYDGVGQALELGTANGRASIGAGTHFASTTAADSIAISFWQYDITSGDPAVSYKVVSSGASDRGAQAHAPWSNGQIYFDTGGTNGAARLQVNPGAPAINQWNHWVFQKSGGNKEIFLNGVSIGSTATASALLTMTGVMHIGSDGGTTSQEGFIDDFAIFDDVLDATQITALAGGTSVGDLVGVPEPSSSILVLLSGLTFGLRRRRG